MIIREREKEKSRYLELTGANLHIASMDLEEQTLQQQQQNNGYVRESNNHYIITSPLTKNRASLLSFQSDDISMYTANEYDDKSDEIDEASYSDTFTATDSDIVSMNSETNNISPKKKNKSFFFFF